MCLILAFTLNRCLFHGNILHVICKRDNQTTKYDDEYETHPRNWTFRIIFDWNYGRGNSHQTWEFIPHRHNGPIHRVNNNRTVKTHNGDCIVTHLCTQLGFFKSGTPKTVLSDNGIQFMALFFAEVFRIISTKNIYTMICHPQFNWQVELFKSTVLSELRCYLGDHRLEWDEFTH